MHFTPAIFAPGCGKLAPSLRAIAVAALLQLLPLRQAGAQDRVAAKYLWYSENDGRIQVSGPSFIAEKEIAPWLHLSLEGVYNAVSGATPTGEPTGKRTQVIEVTETQTATAQVSRTVYHTVTGASGRVYRRADTVTSGVTTATTSMRKQTIILADHPHLPVQSIEDERVGVNGELAAKLGPGTLGAGFSYSTERDYESKAGSVKWTQEFNKKNTVVDAGFGFAHDDVDQFFGRTGSAGKDTYDFHVGVSQILDAATVIDFNAALSSAHGYLADQYKLALVGDALLPEKRPSSRQRGLLGVDLKHYFAPVGGSLTAGYRFGADTFGIASHTASLTWVQKLGAAWTLTLGARGYVQSAADFYGVSFRGTPAEYSADYRLSSLYSLSGEVQLAWKVNDHLTLEAGYERYEMRGRDHATSSEAYPDADVISAGAQLWF